MKAFTIISILAILHLASCAQDCISSGKFKNTQEFIVGSTNTSGLNSAIIQFARDIESMSPTKSQKASLEKELTNNKALKNGRLNIPHLLDCLKEQEDIYKEEIELLEVIQLFGDMSPGVIGSMIEESYTEDDLEDEKIKSLAMILLSASILNLK